MKSREVITIIFTLLFQFVAQAQNDRPEKPNVIVLLTDDLGWQDVDCYDINEPNAYVTPNIDSLRKKGCCSGVPILPLRPVPHRVVQL